MKTAFVFPGQGSQFVGMGKDLYDSNALAKKYFNKSNDILGFSITDIMFEGTDEALAKTSVTQPAIFIHSVIDFLCKENNSFEGVAGHSLGEFSALVAAEAISFEDGLKLVAARAEAMQKACNENPSTMAAILGMDNELVEEVCHQIDEVVVPANYNTIGQIVISGSIEGIDKAIELLKEKGAKRALKLNVNGAFHSPLMHSAKEALQLKIEETNFHQPKCPIYQNVDAKAHISTDEIKQNLINQLVGAVKWTQTIQAMKKDGFEKFDECGPGKVLSGLIRKIR